MPVQKRCSLPNVVTCFCRKSKTGYASLSCTRRTGSLQTSYGSIRRECLSLFQLLFLLGDEDLGQTSGDKRRKESVLEIKESGKIGPRKKPKNKTGLFIQLEEMRDAKVVQKQIYHCEVLHLPGPEVIQCDLNYCETQTSPRLPTVWQCVCALCSTESVCARQSLDKFGQGAGGFCASE